MGTTNEILKMPFRVGVQLAEWGGRSVIDGIKRAEGLGRYAGSSLLRLHDPEKLKVYRDEHMLEDEGTNITAELLQRFDDEQLRDYNTARLAHLVKNYAELQGAEWEKVSPDFINQVERSLEEGGLSANDTYGVIAKLRQNLDSSLPLELQRGLNDASTMPEVGAIAEGLMPTSR